MTIDDIGIGRRVRNLGDFFSIPFGTEGVIVEDYGTGILVAWDLPERPYPADRTPEEIAAMYAANPGCPLRDGFDKETELHYLTIIDENES